MISRDRACASKVTRRVGIDGPRLMEIPEHTAATTNRWLSVALIELHLTMNGGLRISTARSADSRKKTPPSRLNRSVKTGWKFSRTASCSIGSGLMRTVLPCSTATTTPTRLAPSLVPSGQTPAASAIPNGCWRKWRVSLPHRKIPGQSTRRRRDLRDSRSNEVNCECRALRPTAPDQSTACRSTKPLFVPPTITVLPACSARMTWSNQSPSAPVATSPHSLHVRPPSAV